MKIMSPASASSSPNLGTRKTRNQRYRQPKHSAKKLGAAQPELNLRAAWTASGNECKPAAPPYPACVQTATWQSKQKLQASFGYPWLTREWIKQIWTVLNRLLSAFNGRRCALAQACLEMFWDALYLEMFCDALYLEISWVGSILSWAA